MPNAATSHEMDAPRREALPVLPHAVAFPSRTRHVLDKLVPRLRQRTERRLVLESGLFDERWYLERYPDVAAAQADPAKHYLMFGAGEGRDPSPKFSTAGYLRECPDVAASGMNPLLHYVRYGIHEGRTVRPAIPAQVPAQAFSGAREFPVASLPDVCLPVECEAAVRVIVIGLPAMNSHEISATRATLMSLILAVVCPTLMIDWTAISADAGEWVGLWSTDRMSLNRQIMDACQLTIDRGGRVVVLGRIDVAEAPIFPTIGRIAYIKTSEGGECALL